MKNKKLFYGILVVAILVIVGVIMFSGQKQQTVYDKTTYVFDKSKFCPDYGNCDDYGLESRKCSKIGDCLASCSYGCVSRKWMGSRGDCDAMWSNFGCECINSICQRK